MMNIPTGDSPSTPQTIAERMLDVLAAEMRTTDDSDDGLIELELNSLLEDFGAEQVAAASVTVMHKLSPVLRERFGTDRLVAMIDGHCDRIQEWVGHDTFDMTVEFNVTRVWRDLLLEGPGTSALQERLTLFTHGKELDTAWGVHQLVVHAAHLLALYYESLGADEEQAVECAHRELVELVTTRPSDEGLGA
jgi:hypothetical protein